jgi:hypothetical protein
MACYESQVRKKIKDDPRIAKAFLAKAKEHILSGKTLEDTFNAMADETGLQAQTIAHIVVDSKTVKPIMSQMWTARANAESLRRGAEHFIREANTPNFTKNAGKAWDLTRRGLTVGHGGVFPFTHMRDSMLVGNERPIFMRAVKRAYSYAGKEGGKGVARWNRDMTLMKADPTYNFWEKRKLEIGDSAKPTGILSNKMQGWGARGFDALKQARLELAKQLWDGLEPELQTKKMGDLIANQVNHATGAVHITDPRMTKWLGRTMFAPKLYFARKMSAFVDPVRDLFKGGRVTAEQRAAGNMARKRWVKIVGTTTALVAANKAFNKFVMGNDNVNMTDPTKSDWMRMKVGNVALPVSPLFEVLKMPVRLGAALVTKPQKTMRGEKPTSTAVDVLKSELQNSQHPSISKIEELLTGYETYSGRRTALPGLRQMVGAGTDKESEPRLTALEQASTVVPIPIGGAVKEIYQALRENGMNGNDAMVWAKGLGAAVMSGGLGMHGGSHPKNPDYRKMPKAEADAQRRANADFKWY